VVRFENFDGAGLRGDLMKNLVFLETMKVVKMPPPHSEPNMLPFQNFGGAHLRADLVKNLVFLETRKVPKMRPAHSEPNMLPFQNFDEAGLRRDLVKNLVFLETRKVLNNVNTGFGSSSKMLSFGVKLNHDQSSLSNRSTNRTSSSFNCRISILKSERNLRMSRQNLSHLRRTTLSFQSISSVEVNAISDLVRPYSFQSLPSQIRIHSGASGCH
jgi:hypothetical protein